jgi:hypothetical protein
MLNYMALTRVLDRLRTLLKHSAPYADSPDVRSFVIGSTRQ